TACKPCSIPPPMPSSAPCARPVPPAALAGSMAAISISASSPAPCVPAPSPTPVSAASISPPRTSRPARWRTAFASLTSPPATTAPKSSPASPPPAPKPCSPIFSENCGIDCALTRQLHRLPPPCGEGLRVGVSEPPSSGGRPPKSSPPAHPQPRSAPSPLRGGLGRGCRILHRPVVDPQSRRPPAHPQPRSAPSPLRGGLGRGSISPIVRRNTPHKTGAEPKGLTSLTTSAIHPSPSSGGG